MKLGEIIKLGESKQINIEDSCEYIIAGVQSYGKGIVNRRTELGKNMTMKKYQIIEENYLMWCKVDTKNGAFGITNKENIGSLASNNMALGKIDIKKVNPKFLERLFTFDFFHSYITHLSSGTTNRKYLTPKQLCELVEIPNLNIKQQDSFIDLVTRIENLEITTELNHQLSLIKQLRQAFLREAMQGRLITNDELRITNVETGQQLLDKIKAEKAQLIADKKLKKEKELAPITEEEIPFEIPKHWAWCRLGEIINISSGDGLTASQMDKNGTIPVYGGNGINGFHNKYKIEKESIVIGRVGYYCGCVHLTSKYAWVTDNAFIVKYSEKNIDRSFLIQLLKWADLGKQQFAGSQPVISGQRVYPKLIPLPPLHEQEQIVAKLVELMAYCDGLEQSIKTSQTYNEQLLQQVLREALGGEKK